MFTRTIAALSAGMLATGLIVPVGAVPAVFENVGVGLTAGSTALILGPTGAPLPGSAYIDAAVANYLTASGYTGGTAGASALFTPEAGSGASYTQGEADVIERLVTMQSLGQLSADDQTYLFGYSQSSTILSAVNSHLHDPTWVSSVLTSPALGTAAFSGAQAADYAAVLAGIDPQSLHLVLVGDPAADPGNGIAPGFDPAEFTWPWLRLFGFEPMIGVNSNDNLSPTDVFTVDGDNWAQATHFLGIPELFGIPQLLGIPDIFGWQEAVASVLTAVLSVPALLGLPNLLDIPSPMSWQHLVYLGLDSSDFTSVSTVGDTEYFNVSPGQFDPFAALWDSLIASQ